MPSVSSFISIISVNQKSAKGRHFFAEIRHYWYHEVMALRLDVRSITQDARGDIKKRAFQSLISNTIRAVTVVDSYSIDASLSATEFKKSAELLTNPLIEAFTKGRFIPKSFAWAIEVGFLPGVTDNVGHTATETVEDGLGKKLPKGGRVYSSQVFYLAGKLSRKDAEIIAAEIHNPLIQKAYIFDATELKRNKNKAPIIPRVSLKGSSRVADVDLDVSDSELEELGKLGIKNADGSRRGPLALSLDYMKAVREHFRTLKRSPTDVELEALAQTWSEHCKHTIFASPLDEIHDGVYKTYIKGATELIRARMGKKDFCVSVFKDNSGGIEFDDKWVVTHKVETHNSPSALDPFGGAVTGIGGVNRDAIGFGLGAKPVANTYGFCFAKPEDTKKLYRDSALKTEMLPAKRIMEGVIEGVNVGGNQSGIPTPNGFMLFDDSYRGKPLVFVGTVGLIPKKHKGRTMYTKRAKAGDLIVMIGGRVGLDGIHGATFSSVELDSGSPATSVQIGDPITQKKLSDAIVKEARDRNLYNSITDNGAGGLSSSIGEMAREAGGCKVFLEKVPLKYPGLEPWQIWISESQERMTVSVPKNKWKALSDLMKRRGVEATAIGEFTDSGKCVVLNNKKKVIDLDLEFLHSGFPVSQLYSHPMPVFFEDSETEESTRARSSHGQKDFSKTLIELLKQHNLSSNEFISTQFDHEVQAGSVLKPLQGAGRVNADVAVFKPILASKRGVVLSYGVTPYYSPIDPYRMAAAAVDTAIRNAVSAGASLSHLAILDNFCWASSNEPERLWQLKEAARACFDYATLYGTPFISGKDSMFNDFKGYDKDGTFVKLSVLPTLLISSIGVMADAGKAVSLDLKETGDLVYILGETHDELGGSEYYRMVGITRGNVPNVDGKRNLKLYKALERAIGKGLVSSSVSIGKGGVANAILRTSMAGKLGMDISLARLPGSVKKFSSMLFSESQGRVLVTINPKLKKEFESLFKGQSFSRVGVVTKSPTVIIRGEKGKRVASVSLRDALRAYTSRFKHW